jgi:hypothetical protein
MAEITLETPDSPFPNRHFYSIAADSVADFTASFPIAGQHFVLFLAWDARAASDDQIRGLAQTLLSRGLAYLVAWGPDCSRVHDIFDFVFVEEHLDRHPESVVMTTWHDDESLASALWFFLFNTVPDEAYESTTHVGVAAAIGNSEWSTLIRRYFGDKALLDREADV